MIKSSRTDIYEMLKNINLKVDFIKNAAIELKSLIKSCDDHWGTWQQDRFNKSAFALMIIDQNMNILEANQQVYEITGYQPYQLIGKKLLTDLMMIEYDQDVSEFHKRLKNQTAELHEFELMLFDNIGVRRDVNVKIVGINGSEKYLLSIIDIFDLKTLENALTEKGVVDWNRKDEELKESQYRFKEIADLLPGIICEFDMSFHLIYINQKGLQTFGLTQEDYENGLSIFEFIPPELKIKSETDIYNIFHDDFGNPVPYTLYRKDKSIIHVLINSAPIMKNGQPVGMRTCIIDISDRVLAEEKMRISEERFRTIFAESPIGIAMFDDKGFNIEQNRSFRQMFGISDNVKEKDIQLFTFLKLDSNKADKLRKGNVITHETEILSIPDNTGKQKYFEWHITLIGISKKEKPMYLVQVKDITEQKEAINARLLKEKEAAKRTEALIAGLRKELREKESFQNMVSRSPLMKQIFDIIPEVAQAAATVLIYGDSGTGKELIAHSLHEMSSRKEKPFIAINCSALPDTLLESELFGYKAGAFTDAKKDKPGKFAQAEGGTIFLDEIGDISMAMQVKLLRVLQERVYEPLGATSPVKANVRVIAATNKDIKEMVNKGSFREDLYYRINVVTISLPSLNERRCDIPILCEHFIDRYNFRYDKAIKEISKEAMEMILSYNFPGNIRELENIIEHAFIFCKESVIEPRHLPMSLRSIDEKEIAQDLSSISNFDELEKMFIKSIISECDGDKNRAALRLGVHRATLFRKIRQYGL